MRCKAANGADVVWAHDSHVNTKRCRTREHVRLPFALSSFASAIDPVSGAVQVPRRILQIQNSRFITILDHSRPAGCFASLGADLDGYRVQPL